MKQLRSLGFPCELMDIRCAAVAVQARVCHFEALRQGGLQVHARARRLRDRLRNAERRFYSAAVETWLAGNTLYVLVASADRAERAERQGGLRCTLDVQREDRLPIKAGWQASRCQLLRSARSPAQVAVFLRRRLDHWQLGLAYHDFVFIHFSSARAPRRVLWLRRCAQLSMADSRQHVFSSDPLVYLDVLAESMVYDIMQIVDIIIAGVSRRVASRGCPPRCVCRAFSACTVR